MQKLKPYIAGSDLPPPSIILTMEMDKKSHEERMNLIRDMVGLEISKELIKTKDVKLRADFIKKYPNSATAQGENRYKEGYEKGVLEERERIKRLLQDFAKDSDIDDRQTCFSFYDSDLSNLFEKIEEKKS